MRRWSSLLSPIVALIAAAATLSALAGGVAADPRQQKSSGGWTLPADAADTRSPLKVDELVLAIGRKVYADKCQKCHGEKGLGDGPDADPDHMQDMDLTSAKRADRNPDGVVFYKVMNGRRSPKMPSFKDQLSTEQIWSVVAYVQTLRKK